MNDKPKVLITECEYCLRVYGQVFKLRVKKSSKGNKLWAECPLCERKSKIPLDIEMAYSGAEKLPGF